METTKHAHVRNPLNFSEQRKRDADKKTVGGLLSDSMMMSSKSFPPVVINFIIELAKLQWEASFFVQFLFAGHHRAW